MGRKKALVGVQTQEPFELRPFCYYCDREFDNSKTLIQHQRTKHFKCAECGLSFDTVTGLRVHMLNAYKKTMKEVPNAVSGRENPDIVVHGMEGIPKRLLEDKTREAMAEREEKDRLREAESKERTKAKEASAGQAEAKKKLEVEGPPPPAPVRAPPPSAPVPATPAPQASGVSVGESPRSQGGAPASQGMLAGLSPAVAKLLAPKSGKAAAPGPAVVPGLPGHVVPRTLSGLHPVALQVLAFAGVLQPPKPVADPTGLAGVLSGVLRGATGPSGGCGGGIEPDQKRLRIS